MLIVLKLYSFTRICCKLVKLRGTLTELLVSCQVMSNPCCFLAVIFCGFISHLICPEAINIPEILLVVHGFTGITVQCQILQRYVCHGAIVKLVKRYIYPSISFQNVPKQVYSSCLHQEPCHSGGMMFRLLQLCSYMN